VPDRKGSTIIEASDARIDLSGRGSPIGVLSGRCGNPAGLKHILGFCSGRRQDHQQK